MRRTYTIIGLFALTALYFFTNLIPIETVGTTTVNDGQALTEPVITHLHVSILWFIGAILIWYALCSINIVNQWDRRPIMFFGRYVRTLGPGVSIVEPLMHNVLSDVNIQDTVIEVSVEEVQTKDNVGVALIGVLTYRISENGVKDSVVNVDNVYEATEQRALSTLTDTTGTTDLDGLLEHRDTFCQKIATTLGQRVDRWGVEVLAFELKGFTITDEAIAEAVAMKARAQKEGAAEVIRAGLQLQVTTALNLAAEAYTEKGRWLKSMETLIELGRSANNNTIMLPTELIGAVSKLSALTDSQV